MGKKAQKASKAAAKGASEAQAADIKKQKGQAGSRKAKRDVAYDSLRDPLDRELALVGLRVKQITADGNCFFRALSDQLEGHEGQHSTLRARVVAFMKEQEENFAPFVEDDQTFDGYTARMKKEGTWAGHMELQAASLLLKVNIVVYQAGQPRWAITNFPQGTRKLHLSYHDGEHYNSVRRAGDYSPGPPAAIAELAPVGAAAQFQSSWSAADESAVAAGTCCDNRLLIKQQLEAAHGDVDAAIEAVIEILAAEDHTETTPAAAAAGIVDRSSVELGPSASDQLLEHAHEGDSSGVIDAQGITTAAAPKSQAAVDQGDAASTALCERCPLEPDTVAAAAEASSAAAMQEEASHPQTGGHPTTSSSSSSSSSGSSSRKPLVHSKASAKHTPGAKSKAGGKLKPGGNVPRDTEESKKPSRNKPCPCGSGRKHKSCCGLKENGAMRSNKPEAAAADGMPVMLETLHI